ncbi:hypothetical protein P4647_25860 [Peribacillus frigoritolerans]|uniref:hypothetical protein n=1 Tax=Peribacillus frigoritolerans TaxID=450367 RepID=UPI002E1AFFC7|nr:hypothetical protein [Peribacillus frigoritolerans]
MTTIKVLLSIVSGTIVGFVLGLLGGYGSIYGRYGIYIVNPGTNKYSWLFTCGVFKIINTAKQLLLQEVVVMAALDYERYLDARAIK